jgi:hypothetical protein
MHCRLFEQQKYSCSCLESSPESSVAQPLASHYTICVIKTLLIHRTAITIIVLDTD